MTYEELKKKVEALEIADKELDEELKIKEIIEKRIKEKSEKAIELRVSISEEIEHDAIETKSIAFTPNQYYWNGHSPKGHCYCNNTIYSYLMEKFYKENNSK